MWYTTQARIHARSASSTGPVQLQLPKNVLLSADADTAYNTSRPETNGTCLTTFSLRARASRTSLPLKRGTRMKGILNAKTRMPDDVLA